MDYAKFVFEQDAQGRTALMKAASENNHAAIHAAMLAARAARARGDQRPVAQLQAKDGGTALMSAAAHGHTQAMRELLYFDRYFTTRARVRGGGAPVERARGKNADAPAVAALHPPVRAGRRRRSRSRTRTAGTPSCTRAPRAPAPPCSAS